LYQHVFDGQILCGGTGYDYIGIGCSANRSDNKVSTCSSFMPAITKEVSV